MVEHEEDQDPGVVLVIEYGDKLGNVVKARTRVSIQDMEDVLLLDLWPDNKGYIRCSKSTGYLYLHNFIMKHSDPAFPVDHINEDRTDNRRSNLRILSRYDNTLRPVRRDAEEDRLLQDYQDGKLTGNIHELLRKRRNR